MARRKRDGGRGVAGLVALCVAALVLFTVYVREGNSGPLHTVQLGAYEVLRPVREAVGAAASPLSGTADRVSGAFSVGEEEDLRRELRGYREQASEAAALQEENERLRRMLDGERPDYEYGPLAEVISPVGEQFTERMIVDIGSKQGVESGQPVVVGERTLVGRTTGRITANTAEVLLVGDPSFAAGVRIVPPGGEEAAASSSPLAEGLLRTDWRESLVVEYVDREARAGEGDFVVTSGRAGERKLLFPPGLLVGTVSSVGSEDIDQYQEVSVEAAGRPEDAQQVRVILDW